MSASPIEAAAIGASAGAVEALSLILPALPRDFRLPVFVVVHLPPDRPSLLAQIFRAKCQLQVKEAEDKEPIIGGTIYFAPPNYHLLIERSRSIALSSDELVFYSRPAVNVLFESAAEAYGPALAGIILSGANQDGALGLKAVEAAGGVAIVQNPNDAQAAEMPLAALAACQKARILPLAGIAEFLRNLS
jgi:two-component system chemotaxis response regulator CheB